MVKAVIFDMDGVISDTQKLHAKVESEILRRFNIYLTPDEITHRYAGVRTQDFFKDLLDKQNQRYDLEVLINEKWKIMEKYASVSVDAIDGSVELIKSLYDQKYPMAVASASNLNYVRTVLTTLGVIDYFSGIVSGDMVSRGKPDPESFLLAASKINIHPRNCLVIEDGISGMEAAKRANMFCIGLVKDKNKQYPTKNLVTQLSEITPDFLVRSSSIL